MEVWLDTIDFKVIEYGASLGWLHGVTTNPGILSTAAQIENPLFKLLELQPKTVAVQVTAKTSDEMIKEAKLLSSFSKRLLIKIPVNKEGLRAIYCLSQEKIRTLGTSVFTLRQALLAGLAGADYVAPYYSHILREGMDAFTILKSMRELFMVNGIKTKIMGAALKNIEDVMKLAQMGIDAVTLPCEIFMQFIEDDPLSEMAINRLHEKWQKSFGDISILDLVIPSCKIASV